MSALPVIRVIAERIDDVVYNAGFALFRSHPGLNHIPGYVFAKRWTATNEFGCAEDRLGVRRSELRRDLQEAALWVDVNGVPIDPPPVVVRAVGDWLAELGVIQ